MQNISFTTTIPQFRARQKHRTRRGNKNGPTWKNLKPGDVLMGCEQCQGLGKGGKIVRMGPIVILETNIEPLDDIIRRPARPGIPHDILMRYWVDDPIDQKPVYETQLEGFPELCSVNFVKMFCELNDCEPETEINNILFDYVDVKP
jgi:hypothetical protein